VLEELRSRDADRTAEQRQFVTFILLLNRPPAQWVKERRAAGCRAIQAGGWAS
jgi:hypothetical protein